MKRCPNCQKTYDDDQNFCFDDAGQLVPMEEADTPTMFMPDASLPPTQMVNPQQMQNWQQPIVDVSPPPGFNPLPFMPPTQNQPAVAVGNKLAWIGLYLLIGAIVLTFFAKVFNSLDSIGYSGYHGNDSGNVLLAYIAIFVTGSAFLCGVGALILGFTKPQNFGRKILSLCVGLIAGLLFFIQLLFISIGYSAAKSYSSNNYNLSNSSNYSNVNKTPTPVSLEKAILGTWREDGTTSTIKFYDDKSMLLDISGKPIGGTYQITGTNKVAFLRDGVRFKESTLTVTGSKMTMDGTSLTKVDK